MSEKFRDMVPPVTEMEQILAKRKDPKERERVLTFYDTVGQNIAEELDGILIVNFILYQILKQRFVVGKVEPGQNATVNGLLEQLINDLKAKGDYQRFEQMPERERRPELLILLHDRVKTRRDKVCSISGFLNSSLTI